MAVHTTGDGEDVARDHVRAGQVRDRRAGLVVQSRQEADAGAVHDRVRDDGGNDLAPQAVRVISAGSARGGAVGKYSIRSGRR